MPAWARALLWLGLGVGAVAALLAAIGWSEVEAALRATKPRPFALAAALYLLQMPLMGLRWWVGLRLLGHQAAYLSLLRAAAGASVVNFVAPGQFGEPLLAAWLDRKGLAPGVEAFAVLFATKVLATLLNLVLLAACVPGLLPAGGYDFRAQLAVLLAGAALPFAAFVTAMLDDRLSARAAGFAVHLAGRLARRFRPESAERWADRTAHFARRLREPFQLFAGRPGALALVLGLSLGKSALVACSIACVYVALGTPLDPWGALFVQTVDTLGHLASIWIPGDLGVQEVVLTTAAVAGLGLDAPTAAAAALLQKALLAGYVLAAIPVFLLPMGQRRVGGTQG